MLDNAKFVAVMLAKRIESSLQCIVRDLRGDGGLQSGIVRGPVRGCRHRSVIRTRYIVSAVVVVKRRDLQECRRAERMYPGESGKAIDLPLAVP